MGDSNEPESSGWTSPPATESRGARWLVVGGVAAIAGLVVIALGADLLFGITRSSGLGPGELMTMDFGTGATECEVTGQSRSFDADQPVYMVTTYESSLPAGTTLRYDIEFLGASIYNDTEILATETSCSSFPILLPPQQPGHYKMTVAPDTGPPISGEFDIE
jgi:hypothetical protein